MPHLARLALILPLALLLMATTIIAALLGLAASEPGTRWLAAQAGRWTGGLVEWRSIQGSLLGQLHLEEVRLFQPGLNIDIQSVSLRWQAAELTRGLLQIDALEAQGITISVSPTAPTAPGAPFSPTGLGLPLDVSVQGLKLSNLQLVQGSEDPLVVNEVRLDASLERDQLNVKQLTVNLPQGGLSLSADGTLSNPMPVNLQLAWQQAATPTGAHLTGTLAVTGKLHWGDATGFQLSYRGSAEGLAEIAPELPGQLQFDGDLLGEYQGSAATVEKWTLNAAGMALNTEGRLDFPGAAEPRFDLSLRWTGLQWPPAVTEPDISSQRGKLLLRGSLTAYTAQLATTLGGGEIPPGQWQAVAEGNLEGLSLQQLQGSLLGGNLRMSGSVGWAPVPRWNLNIAAKELHTDHLNPDMPGVIAFNLATSGTLEPPQGLTAQAHLERLTGELLGHPVELGGYVNITGEDLELDKLVLQSGGNRITASGLVTASALAVDWQLDAPAPGTLLPGASGRLHASGALAGTPGHPRLQAQLSGRDLAWQNTHVPTLDADMVAGAGATDKLHITVTTGSVEQNGKPLVDALQFVVTGSTSSHSMGLDVTSATGQVTTALQGGFSQQLDAWQGQLEKLEADSEVFGAWHLPQPSSLSLAANSIDLGHTCLKHLENSARLCTRLNWQAAGSGELKAELRGLPLTLLTPMVTGTATGELEASLGPDGHILADAVFAVSPGEIQLPLEQGIRVLSHGGGEFSLQAGPRGLDGILAFDAPEGGQVNAQLSLPALSRWPMQNHQPLQGNFTASLPDLSFAAAWVPELATTSGRLNADLSLAGTLDNPEVLGSISLTDGGADIPLAGLQLRQMSLRASSNPRQPQLLDIAGELKSGPGGADVTGQFDLASSTLALQLRGQRLQVYNTPDARVLLSPELDIGWSDGLLNLRGELLIPRADITPQLAVSPSLASAEQVPGEDTPGQIIAPSPDVVLVNAPQEAPDQEHAPPAPLRLDSQIRVALGDKVKINTLGFISRISGAVTFTNEPGQAELIPRASGRLSLDDGTFRAFGQDLNIETGQLIFADVPATEPELNVRAVRWIDNDPEVTAAGVLVTGSVTEPTIELFSRPQLEASEIQSYLLTGRSSGDKSNVLSIGTYLTPRFYVGYGYNLIEKTNEFNSLFNITPRYGIGANFGEADNNINMTITHEN